MPKTKALKTEVYYAGSNDAFARVLRIAVGPSLSVVTRKASGEKVDLNKYRFIIVDSAGEIGWSQLVKALADKGEKVLVAVPYLTDRTTERIAIETGASGTISSCFDYKQIRAVLRVHGLIATK